MVIAARPVTTRSLGMGEPPKRLVWPSGGVLHVADLRSHSRQLLRAVGNKKPGIARRASCCLAKGAIPALSSAMTAS
jgi:hypothetical protein